MAEVRRILCKFTKFAKRPAQIAQISKNSIISKSGTLIFPKIPKFPKIQKFAKFPKFQKSYPLLGLEILEKSKNFGNF